MLLAVGGRESDAIVAQGGYDLLGLLLPQLPLFVFQHRDMLCDASRLVGAFCKIGFD